MSSIRPARAADADAAVPLILTSGPAAYEYVFALPQRPAVDFLRFAFADGGGFSGYQNHYVVENAGRVVGTGAFYTLEDHQRLARESLGQSTRHYGMIGAMRIVRQSLPVSAMMPAPSADALYVANLAVADDCRGQGIGGLLLEHACSLAREQGAAALELDVAVTNPRAQALYERFGFSVESERPFRGNRKRVNVPDHRRMRRPIRDEQ